MAAIPGAPNAPLAELNESHQGVAKRLSNLLSVRRQYELLHRSKHWTGLDTTLWKPKKRFLESEATMSLDYRNTKEIP
jgi:hypothetical protein